VTASSIRITARVARRLLREVVAEAGRDHLATDMCTYVHVTGERPHCIVGRVLYRAGVTLDELSAMDNVTPTNIDRVRMPSRVWLTWPARMVLCRAQHVQDWGHPWGKALDEALSVRPWRAVA
jgi:hypothetical protein